jgi:diketogulonate reductase-like aldo/keto reductase
MEQLVDAGLCKHIGVSNFTREHLDQILPHCRIKPAMNQIELHPYLPQNELVEYCRSHGILCTAYSPLGSGQSPKLLQDPVIKQVAERRQASAAQVLISWALQRGTVCIPKSITPERIKENAKVIRLTEDDMQAINGIQRRHRYISPAKFWRHRVFPDESEPVPLKK